MFWFPSCRPVCRSDDARWQTGHQKTAQRISFRSVHIYNQYVETLKSFSVLGHNQKRQRIKKSYRFTCSVYDSSLNHDGDQQMNQEGETDGNVKWKFVSSHRITGTNKEAILWCKNVKVHVSKCHRIKYTVDVLSRRFCIYMMWLNWHHFVSNI